MLQQLNASHPGNEVSRVPLLVVIQCNYSQQRPEQDHAKPAIISHSM